MEQISAPRTRLAPRYDRATQSFHPAQPNWRQGAAGIDTCRSHKRYDSLCVCGGGCEVRRPERSREARLLSGGRHVGLRCVERLKVTVSLNTEGAGGSISFGVALHPSNRSPKGND